ncbi:hypothetical protein OROHE_023596 [Orobanche hederae]
MEARGIVIEAGGTIFEPQIRYHLTKNSSFESSPQGCLYRGIATVRMKKGEANISFCGRNHPSFFSAEYQQIRNDPVVTYIQND